MGHPDAPRPDVRAAARVGGPSAGRSTSPDRTPGDPWPFVDREDRLAAVLAALPQSDPGAVIVSGPPGVGRTRLAQEVLAVLRGRGRRTEWATGTRTTTGMPLDALGHLVGGAVDAGSAWPALVGTLARDAAGPAVLGLDDAHLLNDPCASLVHKLVLTGAATVVLTVCTDAPAPALVDALWRDGLAPRVELPPLTYDNVDRLLTAGLGGVVESRTSQRLWDASRGSAVFVHELAEAGRAAGRLLTTGGIWRWRGALTLTPRVRAVVLGQAGDLSPAEHAVVELLAVAGELDLEDLVEAGSPGVVAGLERRGLVRVDRVDRRHVARLDQPLHAEVLRQQLPETLAALYRKQLAAAPSVLRRVEEDPVDAAPLLLQPDFGPDAGPARARAAALANARSDHPLAEQLARCALEDGPDLEASLALVEALRWQGRYEEADRAAVAAEGSARTEAQRARLAAARMLNAFFGRRSPAPAADPPGGADPPRLAVLPAVLRLWAGHPDAAAELEALATDPAGEELPVWRAAAATLAAALRGRPAEAEQHARAGWAAGELAPPGPETAYARALLVHGEVRALALAGRIADAELRAAELHRATLARPASPADAVAALSRGTAALLAGRMREASRWLTEATVQADEGDPLGILSLCWALRAHAAALLGDVASARAAVERADATAAFGLFEPERLLAHAWTAAADGHTAEAVTLAQRAAAAARTTGSYAVETVALHAVVRLGSPAPVLGGLQELAEQLGTPLAHAGAQHARALADGDGRALDRLSGDFEELGACVVAADTAAQAAEAHRDAGSRRSASASAARAAAMARRAGGLMTPALERLAYHSLTQREDEIAVMAAHGASNTEIARRLVLSVRTVETHLAHVYDKLGINSRGALHEAMAAAGWLAGRAAGGQR